MANARVGGKQVAASCNFVLDSWASFVISALSSPRLELVSRLGGLCVFVPPLLGSSSHKIATIQIAEIAGYIFALPFPVFLAQHDTNGITPQFDYPLGGAG